jgi:hypothetical protein
MEASNRLAETVREPGGGPFAVNGRGSALPPYGAQERSCLVEGALAKGFQVTLS